MNLNYDATDAQLLAAGLDAKTLRLSKETVLRPGAVDLDLGYLNAVMDAREQRDLHALAVNNPDMRHVTFPPHAPRMGYMRP